MFYTGDVCFHDQTILKSARFEDVKADVLIMETTRGNREVPKDFTREKEIERLVAAIHAAEKKKGAIMIPSFALGRTQEILALLALLMREGKLKKQPIYIGGLGRVFTEIYDIEAHADAPAAHEPAPERGAAAGRAGKGPGGQHEVDGRKNFCHHRRHDEREHGGAHVWRRG
jgi:Cft2 family RNA processing exonuclease